MCHIYRQPSPDAPGQGPVGSAVTLLESLGFLVNYPKLALTPVQSLIFLGFLIDTLRKELRLPVEKVQKLTKDARSTLSKQMLSARALAGLLGKMSATIQAFHPAPLNRPIPYKG